MKIKRVVLLVSFFLVFTGPAYAEKQNFFSGSTFQLGANLNSNEWAREHSSGGLGEIKTSSGSVQLTGSLHKDKWFTGLTLQSSEFDGENNEPYPGAIGAGSVPTNNPVRDVSRIEILFGYHVLPRVSVFGGLKNYSVKIEDNVSFNQTLSGVGLGVSTFYPLNDLWNLYGSVGIASLSIENEELSVGSASESSIKFGGAYSYSPEMVFTIGMHSSGYTGDYDNGEEVENSFGGISFGLIYKILN